MHRVTLTCFIGIHAKSLLPLKSVIYKANPPSRRIHLQETVGFNQLYFVGKETKATLARSLSVVLFANLREAV
jgi:hypothetical protein